MQSLKNKIEAAAAAGRRSSVEVLTRLWTDSMQIANPGTSARAPNQYSSPSNGLRYNSSSPSLMLSHQRKPYLMSSGNNPSPNALQAEIGLNQGARRTDAVVLAAPAPPSFQSGRYQNCRQMDSSNCNSDSSRGEFTQNQIGGDMNRSEMDTLLQTGQGKRGPVVIIPMSRTAVDGGGYIGDGGRGLDDIGGQNRKLWKSHGNHSMGLVLSALYAKLLVVMGIAFPLSEVMSTYIPASYYDGFYLYLYFGSILFMIWVFAYLIRARARMHARVIVKGMTSFTLRKSDAIEGPIETVTINGSETVIEGRTLCLTDVSEKTSCSSIEDTDFSDGSSTETPRQPIDLESNAYKLAHMESPHHQYRRQKGTHFGSFYLRMGCVAFGIGSMIYSGLEFGQYFELKSDSRCHNYMMALTPSVRMLFTFMQMYFVFLSSRMALHTESLSSQFGLMHMIGTNLCVWLNVLVQETKHEILSFYDPDNKTISFRNHHAHQIFSGISHSSPADHPYSTENSTNIFYDDLNDTSLITPTLYPDIYSSHESHGDGQHTAHHRSIRGLKGPYSIHECGRTNIIGSIVQESAPFLFPCTVEYSLICAAICYVIWRKMAKRKTEAIVRKHSSHRRHFKPHVGHNLTTTKSPHHYTVDCASSHKGLFLGIFVLVLTIMSLIINFVLSKHPDYRSLANLEAHITEIVLYTMGTIAVLIGMCQVRGLRYAHGRNLELDNILLIAAQTGSLIFNIFAIISGQFILKKGENLVLATALLKVIQLLLQTLFILDASKRVVTTMEQAKKKPGREVITFLLITNLAMWLINALEKSRGESHPAQLQFYGLWCWTIITHFAMPLAIFYRFHSTVCLCEIWKRAYKVKHVIR